MSRILRLALCGEVDEVQNINGLKPHDELVSVPEETTDTIKMTGPLSEVYTKALQVVYAKKDLESGLVATESQANDALMHIAIRKALQVKKDIELNNNLIILNPEDITVPDSIYVHTRTADDFTADNITPIVTELANSVNETSIDRTILIVEGGDQGETEFNTEVPEGSESTVREATESICKSMGVEIYYSFEDFVNSLEKK